MSNPNLVKMKHTIFILLRFPQPLNIVAPISKTHPMVEISLHKVSYATQNRQLDISQFVQIII